MGVSAPPPIPIPTPIKLQRKPVNTKLFNKTDLYEPGVSKYNIAIIFNNRYMYVHTSCTYVCMYTFSKKTILAHLGFSLTSFHCLLQVHSHEYIRTCPHVLTSTYVHVHAFSQVRTYMSTRSHEYVRTCPRILTSTYVHVHAFSQVRTYMSTRSHEYVRTCPRTLTSTYVHVHAFSPVRTYMSTHSHEYVRTCPRILTSTYVHVHTFSPKGSIVFASMSRTIIIPLTSPR